MFVQPAQSSKQLLEELYCPILLEPLSNAVSLVPCAHKVQQVAAEKMFGKTINGWQIVLHKPCPMCRTSVIGYMVDHSTRNIVKQLFELPDYEINEMLIKIKNNLAEKCKIVEKDVLPEIQYPGKPARFLHVSGDWNLKDLGDTTLCRMMTFESSTTNSLLKGFKILGYKDNDVRILLNFSKVSKFLVEYFKKFDVVISDYDDHYISDGKDQLKVIFNIISENNEIPVTHFEKIRNIVSLGTH